MLRKIWKEIKWLYSDMPWWLWLLMIAATGLSIALIVIVIVDPPTCNGQLVMVGKVLICEQ